MASMDHHPTISQVSASQEDPWAALRRASSVSSFTGTVFHVYCQQLRDAWRSTSNGSKREQGKSNDRFIRYDPDTLRDCIVYGFDWNELFRHYDLAAKNSTRRKDSNVAANDRLANHDTPLAIVVSDLFLLAPRLVPYACYESVVHGLLLIMLTNSTTRSGRSLQPSHDRLLETIAKLVCRSRHLPLGPLVLKCLEKDNFDSTSADDVDCYRFKYSVLKRLAELLPGNETTFHFPGLLCILQQLDDWDVRLLTTLSLGDKVMLSDDHSGDRDQSTRYKKRKTFVSLGELHGEVPNDDDDDGKANITFGLRPFHMQPQQQYQQRFPQSRVTMKDVLKASCQQNHLNSAVQVKSAAAFTKLPLEAVLLRSKCYKRLLQFATSQCTSDATATSLVFDHIIRLTLHFQPRSAASRLSLILVADAASGCGVHDGYRLLVDCLMKHADVNPNAAEQVWRIYSELLVDGCHFDSRLACWEAMQPLVRAVKRAAEAMSLTEAATLAEHDTMPDSTAQVPQVPHVTLPPPLPLLLRTLAYILSKRRRLLTSNPQDSIGQAIQAFITSLSLSFGHVHYWIASWSNLDTCESANIVQTLHLLGIVGVVGDDYDDEEEESTELAEDNNNHGDPVHESSRTSLNHRDDQDTDRVCMTSWPFAEPNTLRCAHQRMGPKVSSRRLLSRVDHDLHVTRAQEENIEKDSGQSQLVCVPALEYFNDDTLGIVFSFFGYKRLAWVRQVCKTWKEIADQDTLWKDAYVARFRPIVPEDAFGLQNSQGSWKQLFKDKYLAERRIRFLRNKKTGWKVRTCGHVGCLEVLRTPDQLKRHYEGHRQRLVCDGSNKRRRKSATSEGKRVAKSNNRKSKQAVES